MIKKIKNKIEHLSQTLKTIEKKQTKENYITEMYNN